MRTLTPSPPLPRKRGRVQTESVARAVASSASAFASASPPSRKGGATRASLPLERVPFQRDGVRGLAPRDRLGREVVDRDGSGHGGGAAAQLPRLGLGDQFVHPRLPHVPRAALARRTAP